MPTEPTPPKKPFYKQPEWYLEKFAPAIIVVIVAAITSFIQNKFQWIWVYAIISYVIILIVVAVVTFFANKHFNDKHSNPECCTKAIEKTCTNIDQLHCKYSERCEKSIKLMNKKILEQDTYVQEINTFVSNAQQLGKMFTAAVGQRLRTNKQVAEIEAHATVGSEILIMTAYFFLEICNEDMQKSMVDNINRGVKYRYIIPYEKKEDFKRMAYSIFAHSELKSEFKNANKNDFLTASFARKEFFMLTIAYYDIEDTPLANAPSAVVVKLPAEDKDEAVDEKAMIYLVPEGDVKNNNSTVSKNNEKKVNQEHVKFKDNLRTIYRTGIDHDNPELAFTAKQLDEELPRGWNGFKIRFDDTDA